MKRYFYSLVILCNFAIVMALTGCKGRTVENMVPTGDTVEVMIMQPIEFSDDSISAPGIDAEKNLENKIEN